ncbi:unnamed protein product [Didymodactylos carnosus]|nr:unnamed protein product [Didymodactylos carnosus]CAF3698294.1 unnamed protein product [Didymodactylos carnosus]
MPKKKETLFQRTIPGKYIPRDGPPPINGVRSGVGSDNRFNSRMAELLASSAYNNNDSNSNSTNDDIENDLSPSVERTVTISNDTDSPSSRVNSKLLHRRIVTMLETLRRRGVPVPPRQMKGMENMIDTDLQPITFGQLKATTASNGSTQVTSLSERQTDIENSTTSSSINSVSISRSYDDLSDDLFSRLSLNNNSDISPSTATTTKTTNMTQLKSLSITDSCPDLSSKINQNIMQQQETKERRPTLYYSPSLEQLLNQRSFQNEPEMSTSPPPPQSPPSIQQTSTQSTPSVDEIIAKYYSGYHQNPAYVDKSKGFYIHPAPIKNTTYGPSWQFSSTSNQQPTSYHVPTITSNIQHQKPTVMFPPSMLPNQNKSRPPPPSYSSSVAQTNRTKPVTTVHNAGSRFIHPFQQQSTPLLSTIPNSSSFDVVMSLNSAQQHVPLPPPTISISASTNIPQTNITPSKQLHQSQLPLTTQQSALRSPPPRYPIERSHSALSAINRPTFTVAPETQQTTMTATTAGNQNTNSDIRSQILYDREFSRFLYGKDSNRREKRKAYSDPVKKSVEEAGRTDSISIANHPLVASHHLGKEDAVKEEDDDENEYNESGINNGQNLEQQTQKNSRSSENTAIRKRRFQKQSEDTSTRIAQQQQSSSIHSSPPPKTIVPANPLHNRPIPPFLRVYSQAPSSNDILLQWNLFSLHELESFDGMMTKLFKDENLARVQLYETFRSALAAELDQKMKQAQKDADNEEEDAVTAL